MNAGIQMPDLPPNWADDVEALTESALAHVHLQKWHKRWVNRVLYGGIFFSILGQQFIGMPWYVDAFSTVSLLFLGWLFLQSVHNRKLKILEAESRLRGSGFYE